MSRVGRPNRSSHRRSAEQQSQHAARGLVDGEGEDSVSSGSRSNTRSPNAAVAAPPAHPHTLSAGAGNERYETSRSHSRSHSGIRYLAQSPSAPQAPYLALASPSSAYTHDPELVQQYGGRAVSAASSTLSSDGGGMGQRRPLATPLLSDSESSHLLSPTSSAELSQGRLDALIFPEARYSASKQHVRSFYDTQNEFVSSLKKLVTLQQTEEEDEKPSTAAYLAIQISLGLTFVLLGLKLFTAIYSGSIAVVASAVDSGLDVLSQGTLLFTARLMKKYDPYAYPAGKNRMEPVSVLAFSIIMGMAALFLLYESVTDLLQGVSDGGKRVRMDAVTVSILVLVIGIQLVMWIYCKRIAALPIPGANAADALAQDHINDVFINVIGGVPAIIAGYISSAWLADPIGGILLSCYIAVRWTLSALEQIPMLVGKTADPSFLNQLTYLAGTHDPRILKVDTILAYHVGVKYQCEVHIVVPEEMSLKEGHDIGESLETKIERLDCVEMAFVHLDYESDHKPEHAARAIAAGRESAAKKPPVEEQKESDPAAVALDVEEDADRAEAAASQSTELASPVVARSSRRPSRIAAADHSSSSSHLIDTIPAASMLATTARSSNPMQQPITAERAVPNDRIAATGH